jgi:long-chain acyl-CoA synthetase
MSDCSTLPRLLDHNAACWPQRPAWRHKRLGIWQTQSWSEFAARVGNIALGLEALGFGRGNRLAVLGDNRPDLYAALLAAQALGGIGVPLDPDDTPSSLAAILTDARVNISIADTTDRAALLRSLAVVPSEHVYVADPDNLYHGDTWQEMSLDALCAAGRDDGKRETGLLAASVAYGAAQDLALLLYPAGVTGPELNPRTLSHARLLAAAETIIADDAVCSSDEVVCYLPMASYNDAVYSLVLGLLCGCACNCPEAPDSIPHDLREIGPTILFASPAALTALAQVVISRAEATTGLKRRVFDYFLRLAFRAEALKEQRQEIPLRLVIGCRIGELVVFAPVRDQLGLSRTRWVRVDAPVARDTVLLLRALGVPLRPTPSADLKCSPMRETRETLHA